MPASGAIELIVVLMLRSKLCGNSLDYWILKFREAFQEGKLIYEKGTQAEPVI